MVTLLVILHVIVCLFLVGVVLLQQGKSADLAGAFGGQGSQTAFGPRGAANLLTKLTTWSAIVFMLTSIGLTILLSRSPQAPRSSPAPRPRRRPPRRSSQKSKIRPNAQAKRLAHFAFFLPAPYNSSMLKLAALTLLLALTSPVVSQSAQLPLALRRLQRQRRGRRLLRHQPRRLPLDHRQPGPSRLPPEPSRTN